MNFQLVLDWIEHHPGVASWLQALFSVVAIVFAGWFPFMHEKAREKSLRKNCLNTLLYLTCLLKTHQDEILRTIKNDSAYKVWTMNHVQEELELLSTLATEVTVNMLIGVEVQFLADLRKGFLNTLVVGRLIQSHDRNDLNSFDVYVAISVDIQKSIAQSERNISDIKERMKVPLRESWFGSISK